MKANLLGIPVDVVTMKEALETIEGYIDQDCSKQVVTANAEIIYRAYGDPNLRKLLAEADLVTADGSGVVWGAKQLGYPLPERVTGIDLMQGLLGLANAKGYRVYFLGGKPGVAQQAAQRMQEQYPSLSIVGVQDGYFVPGEEEAVVEEIKRVSPHLVFVGLGFPKQEEWIARHRLDLAGMVAIGVGGSFDVLSGQIPRAPRWMQVGGIEWLYRLIRQPWRIRRMSALPKFVFLVWRVGRNNKRR